MSTTNSYNSARRRLQAEVTRREILQAAKRLFIERGFARTSIEEIAREAGVAVQTVYAVVRSKRMLLLQLNDVIDEESGVPEFLEEMRSTQDPRRLLALTTRLTRQFAERQGAFLHMLIGAATGDAELGEILAESRKRHLNGTRMVATRISQTGALRDGVTADDAARLLGAFTWSEVYLDAVRDYQMSFDEAEAWMQHTLEALLFRE